MGVCRAGSVWGRISRIMTPQGSQALGITPTPFGMASTPGMLWGRGWTVVILCSWIPALPRNVTGCSSEAAAHHSSSGSIPAMAISTRPFPAGATSSSGQKS